MKISCQSCQAKYTIADEKVLGKIVKIRCKKCGATIVINGNDPDAAAGAQAGAGGYDDSAGQGEPWTVNVADGDQRTMTVPELVNEYKAGTINDETFCWKDGMNDWLPLREIDTLYQACAMGGGGGDYAAASVHEEPAPAAAAAPALDTFSGGGALFGGGAAAAHADTNGNGSGGGLFASSAPPPAAAASTSSAVARRTGGRGAGGADFFGGVAQAGGEDDVMTSAPQGVPPSAGGGEGKLTGQRNENSVLFSLSALTSNAGGPATSGGGGVGVGESKTTASGDGSGLIDIRALSATMATDTGPKSSKGVDDIMNLGGGGAFSAALAAPVLAPPTPDLSDYAGSGGGQAGGNKTMLYAIIGGCVFIGVAIIVAAVMFSKGSSTEAASTSPTGSAAATDTAAGTGAPAGTGAATAAPTDTGGGAAPIATGVANNGNSGGAAAHHGGGATGGTSGAATHKAGGGGGGDDTSGAAAANTPPAAPKGPADLLGAMNQAAGVKPSAAAPQTGGGSTAPFDRGAAAASLGGVNVASCKKGDGPTGSGHVRVTFQPSGTVSTVEVDQPPFSGTTVGGCVAGKFRSAHVPPFGGGPVTVGKSFNLN